jgi:hypothetical protein
MPQPLVAKLGMYMMPPAPISVTYLFAFEHTRNSGYITVKFMLLFQRLIYANLISVAPLVSNTEFIVKAK